MVASLLKTKSAILVGILTILGGVAGVVAEVKPHALFTENAVLQQGDPVPVWGTADPGDVVTVEFAGQKKTATVDADGRWLVKLDPMKASSKPAEMLISAANPKSEIQNLKFRNILVGEVWLCSGQSNMAWPLSRTENAQPVIDAADDPLLRLFHVSTPIAEQPQRDVAARWSSCTPGSVASFSAVGYYFGRDLRKARDVPVGLIQAAVNGTPGEAWIRREVLEGEPGVKGALDRFAARVAGYPQLLAQHDAKLVEHKAAVEKAKQAGTQPPAEPPPPLDPRKHRARPSGCYNAYIAPLQPFAIKGVLWYQGEGNASFAHEYRTMLPLLIRSWRDAWDREGVQGSEASSLSRDFPFLIVQLAPIGPRLDYPVENDWAELREAQRVTSRTVPGTGLVVITDCGAEKDIHPPRKEPVGARLALAARGIAYGEPIVWSGPSFRSVRVEGDKAIVSFDHVGGGLVAKDGELTGFTIAGEDRKFFNARAIIDGQTVVASSPQVAHPVAVRFGWASFPVVNLYNREGLPASPFRTDDFPLPTAPK